MANEFYHPGDQRAARVKDLFAAIAPRYDRMNDLQSFGLHRRWKNRLLQLARVRPGDRALDVCCGTGDILMVLANCGARAVGVDFSGPMLDVARERTQRHEAVSLLRGDALRLPFADGTFDLITIGYGLRNLSGLEAGLCEMSRVLKPGGRLVALDFDRPRQPLWRAIYFGYLKSCVPCLGRLCCGNAAAYAYILESLRHYPGAEAVAALLRRTGWINVRVAHLLGGIMGLNYAEKPER